MFEVNLEILQKVQARARELGAEIRGSGMEYDMPVFHVEAPAIVDFLDILRNDPELGFNFLTTLCGMHYTDPVEKLGVVYHLHSFAHNLRIRVKVEVPVDMPEVPTVTGIFATANWMERETWDFFGIRFTGHPNLKRILNLDDMEVFPLRKDFPLEDATREDKDDSMFGR